MRIAIIELKTAAARRCDGAMRAFIVSTLSIVFGFALLGMSSAPAKAVVTWTISGGQLVGAQNVDGLLGTFYDVVFVSGPCATVFDGCDDASDFAFSSQSPAILAGLALLQQVFIDGVVIDGTTYNFDTDVGLTHNCQGVTGGSCISIIPWNLPPNNVGIFKATTLNVYNINPAIHPFPEDTTILQESSQVNARPDYAPGPNIGAHWAVFTPVAATVPEPTTTALLALGLLGAGYARRRATSMPVAAHS